MPKRLRHRKVQNTPCQITPCIAKPLCATHRESPCFHFQPCRPVAVMPTPVSSPLALEVRNVCYMLQNGETALEDVSFSLARGESLALVGPNGGGKTTLLRLILGFMPPKSGDIAVFGKAPGKESRRIGYVPQYSSIQPDFPASVLDMVMMGSCGPSAFGGKWDTGKAARAKATAYLEVFGLADLAARPVGALSGGQQQRALAARALMGRAVAPEDLFTPSSAGNEPFLLLLDEPTAGIDPQGKFCFYEFLETLRGSVTIVVVSHDLFATSPFFDKAALVNKSLTMLDVSEFFPQHAASQTGVHSHTCPACVTPLVASLPHTPNACAHPDDTLPPGTGIPEAEAPSRAASPPKKSASAPQKRQG